MSGCDAACSGQKAERLPRNDAQLSLAMLALGGRRRRPPEAEEVTSAPVRAHTRASRPQAAARRMPRVPIEILPPEVEREGRDAFERIGVRRAR